MRSNSDTKSNRSGFADTNPDSFSDSNTYPNADAPAPATGLKPPRLIDIIMAIRPWFLSQVRLHEIGARVNVDRPKPVLTRVNKSMRHVGGNDHDTAGFNLADFIADRKSGSPFNNKPNFDIGVDV